MSKILNIAIALLCMLTILGCVSRRASMKHPTTQDVQYCASTGWGWAGAPYAVYSYNNCIHELRSRGYEERGLRVVSPPKPLESQLPTQPSTDSSDNKSSDKKTIFTSIPEDIKQKILQKCAADHFGDYTMQVSCAEKQAQGWKKLNQ